MTKNLWSSPPNIISAHRRSRERSHAAGLDDRVVVGDEHIVRASIQGPLDSSIISTCVSQVPTRLEEIDVGECRSKPISGTVG